MTKKKNTQTSEAAVAAVKPTQAKSKSKAKLDLKSIALGALVGQIRDEVVQFLHDGKLESVDIRVKQLSYAVTEPLYTRMNKGDDVVAEWISAALVDENGDNYLSPEQVNQTFTQNLATAVFFSVTGLESALKFAGKTK